MNIYQNRWKKTGYRAVIFFVLSIIFADCSHKVQYYYPENIKRVRTGVEIFLEKYAGKYRKKNVVVITNHSGVNFYLEPNIRLFKNKGLNIITILAPEHGLYGFQNEYEKNVYNVDPQFNSIVYNLHKLDKNSLGFLLDRADVVIFDIQDMGMRCYTYISNLKFIMDTMKDSQKELIVLDRPNPIGFLGVDGAYLEKRFTTKYISAFPAPFIYDMTIGEAALYYKGEFAENIHLKVIKMDGYKKDMLFNETGLPWIPPSPNLPTYESAIIYTFTVLMEGINISLGRGTAKPFEYIGAPWIDPVAFCKGLESLGLKNFTFRPVYFQPTFSKFSGRRCGGAHIFYTGGKFTPSEVSYNIIKFILKNYTNAHWIKHGGRYEVDLLCGTDKFRKAIDSEKSYWSFSNETEAGLADFNLSRWKYQLY